MKRILTPSVYIMGNDRPTLYIGVSSEPLARIHQHKTNQTEGFTKKYRLHKLLHIEFFDTMEQAINREKQLKRWHRVWKLNLIKANNPNFEDLYSKLLRQGDPETSSG